MRFLLPCLCLLASPLLRSESERTPWDNALNFDYNTASQTLAHLHANSPDDGRLALAHAAVLLARQPRTNANIQRARALTAARVEVETNPSLRARALLLLARIDHDHLPSPDLPSATSLYHQLRRDHPDSPLADHAAVHLALIAIYQSPDLTPSATLDTLSPLLASIQAPSARRELLQLTAFVHLSRLNQPADALPLLLEGRALGYEAPLRNGDFDLLIADSAQRARQPALAARHYLAFADANPRDVRAGTARRLAAEALALSTP